MNRMPEDVEILIVEDSPTQALQLQFVLEEQGYRTQIQPNGEQALAYLQQHQPALVISAVVLPGMDGYQLCKRIKTDEQLRHLPVILLTSLAKSHDMIKGLVAGADNFVVKSADWITLLTHIPDLVAGRETETNLFLIDPAATPLPPGPTNRATSEFLASMSHELRTPLNAILGFAQVMTRSSTLPPEHRENLSIIMQSGEHLLTLINNILELSRIEAGRIVKNEKNFDLYQFLDDLEDIFRLRAEDKGLRLIFDYSADLPQYICMDEAKLRQVLSNLLNNAIKFTDKGDVSLRIRDEKLEAHSGQISLIFEVEDTGPGIALDRLKTIFEAFRQTQMGKKAGEGTGLGLPISRQLVRLMGGELRLNSEVGGGTRLKFCLPANLVQTGEIESSRPVRRMVGLAPHQPRYRILIADDSPTNRLLLTQLLGPLDFEIRETANGQEAVELWEQWEPDLIFMDIRMPIMDGYEAARRIKTTLRGQATAIVALTASALEEERAIVLAAGCDDFLRKPFREAELFEMLSKHLGVHYRYEDEEAELGHGTDREAAGRINIPAALASLPPDLLAALEQTTARLDIEMIDQTIDQIFTYQPPLAQALTMLAKDFDFDEILTAIQKAQNQNE